MWGDVPCETSQEQYCPECKQPTCLPCDAVHDGLTCEQHKRNMTVADARQEEVAGGEAWLASNAKKCPWCNVLVHKEAGCDHCTCEFASHLSSASIDQEIMLSVEM